MSFSQNTPGKNPAETQSMTIQVKSGEIPVRKKVEKIMLTVADLQLNQQS